MIKFATVAQPLLLMDDSPRLSTVHDSRTLMLSDLALLIDSLPETELTPATTRHAVIIDNVLGKKTQRTRAISFKYLQRLYGLDERQVQGRLFFSLFRTQPAVRGQLGALIGLTTDRLFQASLPSVLSWQEGQAVDRTMLIEAVRLSTPGIRETTLKSATQNLLSSWSQAGWLSKNLKKRRIAVQPSPEGVALALFLGYQEGRRGLKLLDSPYMEAFGSSPATLDDLAYQASRLGYLQYRRIADVFEVQFSQLQRDGSRQ